MSKEPKFFICKHCGNIMTLLKDSHVPVVCCGEDMTELKANTSDGATEKHVPVVEVEGESSVAAFEYCNLHGLWKASI